MKPLVLIAGATGYVGGELLNKLLDAGYNVRCLARRPEVLRAKALPGLEVVEGDVLSSSSVRAAMAGVSSAYYLVHSMGSTQSFEEQDRTGAQNFANAARDAGVQRIIYLGGLGRSSDQLSTHLRSRQEVGEILRSTAVPVIEFRASVVIGSGSLSFELIRALVERLPVMIAPRWVSVDAQPIAIADLLAYLLAAMDHPIDTSKIFEIGGSDRVSYGGLMREYARQRGLKRLVVSVPFLTPRLSSLWLGLVTPHYVRVGRKLIDSIRHSTVVEDPGALTEFGIRPCGFREAISAAIHADTTHLQTDSRMIHVNASQADAFAPIRRIGGASGWYYANWLWQLRGWMDKLVGGVGMTPRPPRSGFALCWRCRGLLARGGDRARSLLAPGRGDEAPWPRVPRVRSDGRFHWIRDSPNSLLQSLRIAGSRLLVLRASFPPLCLQRHAAGHRGQGPDQGMTVHLLLGNAP